MDKPPLVSRDPISLDPTLSVLEQEKIHHIERCQDGEVSHYDIEGNIIVSPCRYCLRKSRLTIVR